MDPKKLHPIEHSIQQQMEGNKSKNLLFIDVEQIMEIEPGFLAALEELLDSTSPDETDIVSSESISFAARSLLKNVYSVNQYLKISDQKVKELEQIYKKTWLTIKRTGNIQNTLKAVHYPEISRWLAALYPEKFRKQLEFSPVVGRMVYEEYSAQLQIELLQLDLIHMQQPVIDIGCGSQANLVRYLRSQGFDAYGFDLHLEIQAPYLQKMDWFEYPFRPAGWGTIISNMAFTNHFNYAYLHDISQLEPYARRMKDIIESLAIAGRFYYAPGLAFVENRFAPERYTVEQEKTIGEIYVSIVTRIA